MLTAHRSLWFERVFCIYNRNLLRRRFERLRIAGLDNLSQHEAGTPIVLYANHSSWWDGLVAFEVGVRLELEQYVMMEEQQLVSYPLFRRLGAFSVSRGEQRATLCSINYAAELLRGETREQQNTAREARRALWIFPQGEITPNDLRPLAFHTGAARIIRRLPSALVLPVAMRFEHAGEFRPEILVRIGASNRVEQEARAINVKQFTRSMETHLTSALDCLRDDVLAGDYADYVELIARKRRSA